MNVSREPEASPARSWPRRWLGDALLDVTPLRASRDFRLLFLGQFVSKFGTAIRYVVLPLQLWQLTKSTALVGLLGVAEFVPLLGFAFLGGALADAVGRPATDPDGESGMTLCCVALVANALLPEPRVGVLFFVAALLTGFNALHRPDLDSLTPRLVAPEHLAAASALSTFTFSFNYIIGPALRDTRRHLWHGDHA